MNKNKIIYSIFSTIFFANFSFAMDNLVNGFNNMQINEIDFNEIRKAYEAELADAYDIVYQELPEMNQEQRERYNANQGARRRLNF